MNQSESGYRPGAYRPAPSECGAWAGVALATGLAGCATPAMSPEGAAGPREAGALAIEPVMRVDGQPSPADVLHAAAREALQAGQPVRALERFDAALVLSPWHAEAANGRAVALARLGRLDEAAAMWRRLLERDPSLGHVASNLARAEASMARAGASPEVAAAIPAARSLPLAPAPAPRKRSTLVEVDRQVWQLEAPPRVPARDAVGPAAGAGAARMVEAPGALQGVEVRNGSGVPGLARRTAAALRDAGVIETARLTNRAGYGLARTELHHRPGDDAAALLLSHRLARPVVLRAMPNLPSRTRVRLVLGQDMGQAVSLVPMRAEVAAGRATALATVAASVTAGVVAADVVAAEAVVDERRGPLAQ